METTVIKKYKLANCTILTNTGQILFNAVRTRNIWNESNTGKFLAYDQNVIKCQIQENYIPDKEVGRWYEKARKGFGND